MQDETDDNQSSSSSNEPTRFYCTSALPGQVFQEFYLCRKCCQGHACVCAACAQTCHVNCRLLDNENGDEEEAVEYVGLGPASCDCHGLFSSGCRIHAASMAWAQSHGGNIASWDAACTLPRHEQIPLQVYDIPYLQQSAPTVMAQAQFLIQHSKETFWIDANCNIELSCRCLLEHLAIQILQFHTQKDDINYCGAEWWVQVKEPRTTNDKSSSAIELHYDKDEILAEAFGIGVFPTCSTVTYLTGGAPTLIFPRTYHDDRNRPMSHVTLSKPLAGKHLVFDGQLLHGAIPFATTSQSQPEEEHLRVTFLVNLWKDHQPLGIQALPDTIRQALQLQQSASNNPETTPSITLEKRLSILPSVKASSCSETTSWMNLPFVQDGMVVKSVDLAEFLQGEHDVVQVEYQEGMHAYLDYPDESENMEQDENDDPEEKGD